MVGVEEHLKKKRSGGCQMRVKWRALDFGEREREAKASRTRRRHANSKSLTYVPWTCWNIIITPINLYNPHRMCEYYYYFSLPELDCACFTYMPLSYIDYRFFVFIFELYRLPCKKLINNF